MKKAIIFTSYKEQLLQELSTHNILAQQYPEPDDWIDKLGITEEEERRWIKEVVGLGIREFKYIISTYDYNYLRLTNPEQFISYKDGELIFYPLGARYAS